MLIFARMLPMITASLEFASSANGNKNPLKNADVLKMAFLTAM
jgi:hypothetical protein